MKHASKGFTLIEVSIVILIVGLLLGPALMLYSQRVETLKREETQLAMLRADNALTSFRSMFGRYPCPAPIDAVPGDPEYGYEECSSAVSGINAATSANTALPATEREILIGTLPFREMNMQHQDSFDGRNNRLTYAVMTVLTNDATFDNNKGGISIVNAAGNNALLQPDTAHFAIITHGKESDGAITRDGIMTGTCSGRLDSENCDGDAVFMTSNVRDDFDDQVIHATEKALEKWKYVSSTSQDVILNNAQGFGAGLQNAVELASAGGLTVLDTAATGDAIVLASGGAFLSGGLCDYADDTDCFLTNLIAGQHPGEGMDCPGGFLIGIKDGAPVCSSTVNFSCPDNTAGEQTFFAGVNADGELICNDIPAPRCPSQIVTPACGGGSETLPETADGQFATVESGECHYLSTFSASTADALGGPTALENYIDDLNNEVHGGRSTSDCDLVRDVYRCDAGTWTHVRTHEMGDYGQGFPGNPMSNSKIATTSGPSYSLTASGTANDCWCREDYGSTTSVCTGGGATGSVVDVSKYRCPQTGNNWTDIYSSSANFCSCADYNDIDSRACWKRFGLPWSKRFGVTGNHEETTYYVCDASDNHILDPAQIPNPEVTFENCICPDRKDKVTPINKCPTHTTNSWTYPDGMGGTVTADGYQAVKVSEWNCPTGVGGSVSSAPEAGDWQSPMTVSGPPCNTCVPTKETENRACTDGSGSPDPTKSGFEVWERTWDCVTSSWGPWTENTSASTCTSCRWLSPDDAPEEGNASIGKELGQGGCMCGDAEPICHEKAGAAGKWNLYSPCECDI